MLIFLIIRPGGAFFFIIAGVLMASSACFDGNATLIKSGREIGLLARLLPFLFSLFIE